jgi:hypothetical protein
MLVCGLLRCARRLCRSIGSFVFCAISLVTQLQNSAAACVLGSYKGFSLAVHIELADFTTAREAGGG